jgi:signal peptidase I
VSETAEIPSTSESVAEIEPVKGSLLTVLRQLLATLLSAAWPGLGHLVLGQVSKGMLLSASFVVLLSCFWPLRMLRYYPGFFVLYCGWLLLGLYSSCSAQLALDSQTGRRISKWWFAITIPSVLIIISIIGGSVTRASGFRSFEVPSTSMEPTIQHGDRIVVDSWAFRTKMPQYRDVVVCYRSKTYFIKRIIGMGVDTIEDRDGSVLVNGNVVNESYIQHWRTGSVTDWQEQGNTWMQNFGPVSIPNGRYFVLGDNRDESLDSRSPEFGLIDQESVIGRVLYICSTARGGGRVR